MSDVEKKSETQEAAPKKKPYNLREKKEKKAAYRSLIRAELADELYDKILNIVVVQKKYKDPNYSAKDLAKELKTNTRYLSAVVNSRFGMNYSCLARLPMRIALTSPRNTALNQMLQSFPITTSPIIVALSAK